MAYEYSKEHATCFIPCSIYLEWVDNGYWEDMMSYEELFDEDSEESFTIQERNPGFRNW